MKSFRKWLLISASILLFSSLAKAEGGGSYSIAGFDDPAKVEQFVKTLQEWVAKDQKEAIAGVVRFPLKVRLSSKRSVLRNKKEFLRHYSDVFNAKVKDAVLQQDSGQLFANWQGAMLGNGEIWIGPTEDHLIQIIAINN